MLVRFQAAFSPYTDSCRREGNAREIQVVIA